MRQCHAYSLTQVVSNYSYPKHGWVSPQLGGTRAQHEDVICKCNWKTTWYGSPHEWVHSNRTELQVSNRMSRQDMAGKSFFFTHKISPRLKFESDSPIRVNKHDMESIEFTVGPGSDMMPMGLSISVATLRSSRLQTEQSDAVQPPLQMEQSDITYLCSRTRLHPLDAPQILWTVQDMGFKPPYNVWDPGPAGKGKLEDDIKENAVYTPEFFRGQRTGPVVSNPGAVILKSCHDIS
ncbi:hypothetical protein BS47DRAFT_1361322 [Hydnum rufescens UP504]|uniref:Uncharacterized protein n=1 Tax=Hydnum rufescens UP504 TaxID=1448309 RepID=A0A9P6B144_9AGAM|nr:hypothetical protein BS47DRAFT_1361322 [Hydnum rufescens UP504]